VKTSRWNTPLLGTILLLAGCGTHMGTSPRNAGGDLGGSSWQLVKFQGSDDKTLTPDDKAKYTIHFNLFPISTLFDYSSASGRPSRKLASRSLSFITTATLR